MVLTDSSEENETEFAKPVKQPNKSIVNITPAKKQASDFDSECSEYEVISPNKRARVSEYSEEFKLKIQ